MAEVRVQPDERDIRMWFARTDLDQARDTFHVCEGIIQARMEAQPRRRERSDKGTKRKAEQPSLLETK